MGNLLVLRRCSVGLDIHSVRSRDLPTDYLVLCVARYGPTTEKGFTVLHLQVV